MKLESSNLKIYLGGIYLIVLCITIYFLFSTFDIKDLTSYEFIKEKRLNTKYFTIFFSRNSKNFRKGLNKYLNISFVIKKKLEML